jgi:hypothetical protein
MRFKLKNDRRRARIGRTTSSVVNYFFLARWSFGLPNQLFQNDAASSLAHLRRRFGRLNLAVAVMRRSSDSSIPDGNAGLRIAFDG